MSRSDRSLSAGAKAFAAVLQLNQNGSSIVRPHWYDCRNARGKQIKGINRVNFNGATVKNLSIVEAFAENVHFSGATIENTVFDGGDFSRADFSGATFRNTRFMKTILTGANFDDATFVNCNLDRVNLVGASFCVKEITETVVYGIAAWDLRTSDTMKQSKLVIERTAGFYSDMIAAGDVPLMVDDIQMAQFVYYLSKNKTLQQMLTILSTRGVLLLGAFENGGLERLDRIRERLARHGYMTMIFNFNRPDSRSLEDTIGTMAGLAKFIVADVSGPSVPQELKAILQKFKRPILAIGSYALLYDLEDDAPLVTADNDDEIEDKLPELERLHENRVAELAARDLRRSEARLRQPRGV